MELREKIARAIWDAEPESRDEPFGNLLGGPIITDLYALADDIIDLLREPTDAMIKAGFDNDELGIIWTAAITPEDRRAIWKAMLAAA